MRNDDAGKATLVTGASSGIGALSVRALALAGHTVCQDSADAAVDRIFAERGRLDVVVHNAGHMVLGAAEAFTAKQLADLTT